MVTSCGNGAGMGCSAGNQETCLWGSSLAAEDLGWTYEGESGTTWVSLLLSVVAGEVGSAELGFLAVVEVSGF